MLLFHNNQKKTKIFKDITFYTVSITFYVIFNVKLRNNLQNKELAVDTLITPDDKVIIIPNHSSFLSPIINHLIIKSFIES